MIRLQTMTSMIMLMLALIAGCTGPDDSAQEEPIAAASTLTPVTPTLTVAPSATPTNTQVSVRDTFPVASHTPLLSTETATLTFTPTPRLTDTPAHTSTATIIPTLTPTHTPTITPTPESLCEVIVLGPNGINVRAEPGLNARIITIVSATQFMQVFEQAADRQGITWYRVRTDVAGNRVEGWVRSDTVEVVGRECPTP